MQTVFYSSSSHCVTGVVPCTSVDLLLIFLIVLWRTFASVIFSSAFGEEKMTYTISLSLTSVPRADAMCGIDLSSVLVYTFKRRCSEV